MNWKEIKDSYPESFKIFQKYLYNSSPVYGWDIYNVADEEDEEDYELRFFKYYSDPEKRYAYDLIDYRFYQRDLYDFFDKQGINVHVWSTKYTTGQNWEWQLKWYLTEDKWLWHGTEDLLDDEKDYPIMIDGGTFQYGDNGEYTTRTIAEVRAFRKAFEILNEKDKHDIMYRK